MEINNQPLGVFDSGLGGLTVVKEIMGQLPRESILYFGDTARMPYGSKAPEEIVRFSLECLHFLVEKGAKFLVIACNTVSVFLDELQAQLPVPMMGVIGAGARSAVAVTQRGSVGVMATEATVNSDAYSAAIQALKEDVQVYSHAAPLLAPMAEEGRLDDDATLHAVKNYVEPFLKENIDTLVLGCTHYPPLKDAISAVTGPHIRLVDPAVESARQLAAALKQRGLERQEDDPTYKYYVSAHPNKFSAIGPRFLGRSIDDITLINPSHA